MKATFEDFSAMAESCCGGAYSTGTRGSFAVMLEDSAVTVEFLRGAGDPAAALVRARILDLRSVPRAADFAKAALAANFFWGGTRGATLSVAADGALYATERRMLDELCDAEELMRCLDDFAETALDWRERSVLYA